MRKFSAFLLGEKLFKATLLRRYKRNLARFLDSGKLVEFRKQTEKPSVSIIIPTYNGAHHLLRCLLSLHKESELGKEIIVYDDGSFDKTTELLSRFRNIKSVKGERNVGFLRAVNSAAALVSSDSILLLNNDAVLISGSVHNALDVLDRRSDAGAVGCRVVRPTGMLQEAGCMIYRDGATDGYLREQRADDPRALFEREVDYCSGAFLLMRTRLFRGLGGLDERFSPAYYEESDLCLRMRQQGYSTIYTPRVVVEHFEFGSMPAGSAFAEIARKREVFSAKWQVLLGTGGFADMSRNQDTYARRLLRTPRVLLVATAAAQPDSVASATRKLLAGSKPYGHVCSFIVTNDRNGVQIDSWRPDDSSEVASGSIVQLKQFCADRSDLYDEVLAFDDASRQMLSSIMPAPDEVRSLF
jgi:GT2 family glycosyltransferase